MKWLSITSVMTSILFHTNLLLTKLIQNIKNIIKDYADKDEDGCRAISSEGVASAMSDIFDWLLGRDLATMCANDELDCYWDDDINEMVFKAKEEKRTIEETYSKRTRPRRPNE